MTTATQDPGGKAIDPSPLVEASPQSLDELFSRDPMKYLQKDREQIVAELRRQRQQWDAGQGPRKSPSPGSKPKVKGAVALPLDLKSLGLID